MRRTYLTVEMGALLSTPQPAPGSRGLHGYSHLLAPDPSKKGRVAYAVGQKLTWLRANGDRSLTQSLAARLRRAAYLADTRALMARIFAATKRFTLYTPAMDADKLIERAREDVELDLHVRQVMAIYRQGYSRRNPEHDFLTSKAGQKLCDYVGFVINRGAMYDRNDLPTCMYCDEHVFPDDEVSVYDSYEDAQSAHVHCARDNAYRCEVSGRWYEGDDEFYRLQDTGERANVAYCQAHGFVHSEWDEDEDCGVYYRRRPDSGGLVGYHDAPRPWMHDGEIPNGYIGVELELGFKDGEEGRSQFLRKYVQSNGRFKDDWPFSCERDGSLRDVPGGMEIISDPLELRDGYQKRTAPWRKLLKALYDSGAQGWAHRNYAGLHVNLCVRDEPRDSVFKYAAFIGNAEAMSKLIAGRKNIYGTEQGYIKVPRRMVLADDTIDRGLSQVFRAGKYAAVSRRDETCLETRIFGSNIRYAGFMACVEYCVAVMAFVGPLHRLDVLSPTVAAEFRQWLGSHTRAYPNLAARLGIVAHDRGTAFPSDKRLSPVLAAA